MYSIVKQSGKSSAYVTDFIADLNSDIAELPKDVAVGSTCFVIESSKALILGNDKEWHEI